MKITVKFYTCLLLFLSVYSYGQMDQYNYKQELKGVSAQWHNIVLPNKVYAKTSQQLSDIRIFGVTSNKDTIEAPYILRQAKEEINSKNVNFKTLNKSHTNKGFYYTFEIPSKEIINQIKLDFNKDNFDWRIKLEASLNQQQWFTVLEDYRILSIKNSATDFQFTSLNFPNAKYGFYRLFIETQEKPDLLTANIRQQEIKEGLYNKYRIKSMLTKENKKSKYTEIDIELDAVVPISNLKITITDTFDYYRPLTIKYCTDSVETEKGWIYNYSTLSTATLNSIEKKEFKFRSTTLNKLKVLIHNQDNSPLHIGDIEAKGYVHELVARFTEPATYFLTYGSDTYLSRPKYDISQFQDKIPASLIPLQIADQQLIEKAAVIKTEALFKNKLWLWIVMGVIIVLLGGFSFKMIKKS